MLYFNQATLQQLRSRGISFSRAATYPFAHPDISLEPPFVVQGEVFLDGILKIGAFTGVYGGRLRHVSIGRYCSIAPGLDCGWDDHPSDWLTSSMMGYVPDIHGWRTFLGVPEEKLPAYNSLRGCTVIGNDVWIGQGVFLRAGVTIGDGAIIGARSVVTHDVPPYSVVVGQPARIIKSRFSDELIKRMMAVRWWRYNLFDLPKDLIAKPEEALDYLERNIELGALKEYLPSVIGSQELSAICGG